MAVIRIKCKRMSDRHPANSLFRSVGGRSLNECRIGRITYGDWRGEDVVVVRTQEAEWEVNCHGGSVPIKRILSDLAKAGIKTPATETVDSPLSVQWSSMLQRTRTMTTADLILGQPTAIHTLAAEVAAAATSEEVLNRVNRFLGWKQLANHLVEPWLVAIAGQPNAGKSSLLNSIVGYQRSIVFDQPGTTRDTVACDVVVGGWPVRFVDTAGIREQSGDSIERQGISAARDTMQAADLCLFVVDQVSGFSEVDHELIKLAPEDAGVAVVRNKTDLVSIQKDRIEIAQHLTTLSVSAKTGHGVAQLLDWVASALVPTQPSPTEALPILPELTDACEEYLRDGDKQQLGQRIESIAAEVSA